MPTFQVDGLTFSFPAGWQISKYDDWAFYRNRFVKMWDGIKAVDLLALSDDRIVWFIEVKDYRRHSRTKPSGLAAEVGSKVFDTLAAMLPARLGAQDDEEHRFAKMVGRAKKLRVVLQLEQPLKHSKMFPRAIDPADVNQSLRQMLKPIDAHPLVVETSRMPGMAWTVT